MLWPLMVCNASLTAYHDDDATPSSRVRLQFMLFQNRIVHQPTTDFPNRATFYPPKTTRSFTNLHPSNARIVGRRFGESLPCRRTYVPIANTAEMKLGCRSQTSGRTIVIHGSRSISPTCHGTGLTCLRRRVAIPADQYHIGPNSSFKGSKWSCSK
ncbi:uncharacterized protein K460DRAFT_95957 [Cucurbitaria berberidis CBS 394.84]|uniref:Uncharacterized protein n=1 Tax=Cucurbitaria berberidis CBS 394.84 TaxID=1168544 RepID=A0A9P4GFU3_9PLEO|nr:uncharacterized protein K460DRAFT_95957 [Cucurbitaria berberidis CBS 394.84]KAF1844664.1 hypothetical protein K460DRAFT_95957 [Cucurbitaria berberidis CBS 394.84]